MQDKERIKNYAIGVDIGGTKMLAILFDCDKQEPVSDYKLATPRDNLEKFLVMLWALIDPLIERARQDGAALARIGIGAPGILDQPTALNPEGRLIHCLNLPILDDISLGRLTSEKYNLPVLVDNDANCFLRAEMSLGAGRKSANAIGVTLGTGIGGAIGINREVFQGPHGSAGELGYMIVDVVEGQPHTLEEIYQNLTQHNPLTTAQEAYDGDKLAMKIYEEVGRFIGLALANAVNMADTEIIILGGSLMKSSDLFMRAVKKSLKAEIASPKLKKIKVVPGKLEQAGAIGAALLKS